MNENHGVNQDTNQGTPKRGSMLWLLVFLVYLFLMANTLFTGMFAEIEDYRANSYRPDTSAETVGYIAALAVTVIPLAFGLRWWWTQSGLMDSVSAEERLIIVLMVTIVAAAAVRSGLTLALRLEVSDAMRGGLEAGILALQIGASLVLVGGSLRLLMLNQPDTDSAADTLGDTRHNPRDDAYNDTYDEPSNNA